WFLTEELQASIWLLRYCNLASSIKMPTPFIQMPPKLKAGGNMHKKSHIVGHIAYIGLYVMLIISTIFLYNSADLAELLYAGWIIMAFGIVFLLCSSKSRKKGHAEGIKLVERGMYAFVRHPEFLGHILIIFALVIISQHWFNFIVGAILIVLLCFAMIEEEKRNMEKFGNAYRDYMKRVPRINLIAGIIRQINRRK
ncbi:MAG: isoprenylcysteine carboxylmethyltransferase family protein, partial [Methanophagales archaeon]|nr:isoprenylcysteine carboxylmethyltransferase family protein [Methanophagales archaeon]